MNEVSVLSVPRPKYSALFTLLDYLDLSQDKELVVEKTIVSLVRKMFQNGEGAEARFDVLGVLGVHRYGGYRCTGEADEKGWKRLVIKTDKHNVVIWPLGTTLSFTEQYHANSSKCYPSSSATIPVGCSEKPVLPEGQNQDGL